MVRSLIWLANDFPYQFADAEAGDLEEHELENVSTTANGSYVNDALPAHDSPAPIESAVPVPTGENMHDVEPNVRETEGVQP